MEECIFCKIVKKQSPAEVIFENNSVFVVYDIHPKAPVHALILSKRHIGSIKEVQPQDSALIGEMILAAQHVAKQLNLNGYKLIFNVGREGGQLVDHLHLHLLGGWDQETHKVEV